MIIRNIEKEDLDVVLDIYEHARKCMRATGNPNQWGLSWPPKELIISDIENKTGYVIISNDKIIGVFAYITGIDPTYEIIDGAWLNDAPYGTIHRIASLNVEKGILEETVKFGLSKGVDVRIDTHKDNAIMRHLLEKLGFIYTGVIKTHDGSDRLAFQKVYKKENQ